MTLSRSNVLGRSAAGFFVLALAACSPADDGSDELPPAWSDKPAPMPHQIAQESQSVDPPSQQTSSLSQPPPLEVPERVARGIVTESGGGWNKAIEEIRYVSTADSTPQPAMFYRAPGDEPRPLLVGLHSWSSGYRQGASAIYAEWAIANGWHFIHPHLRGPMRSPQATGSDLVIADAVSAIDYVKNNANVDQSRIYAIGYSGGGFHGLLLAGREPQIWAGVSAWVPISDLNAWYAQAVRQGTRYPPEIAASCGGEPVDDTAAARECRKRSPLTYIETARNVIIDIHHGIHDGHGSAPVPISQSLIAFNALAVPEDRFTEEQIAYITKEQKLPPELARQISDGNEEILLRRQSNNVRITIFNGGHDKNTEAGVRWLNQQRKVME